MTQLLYMTAILAGLLLPQAAAVAQTAGDTTPPGVTWAYECKAGLHCPSSCSIGGKELFSTSDYHAIYISVVEPSLYWIRVDTGQNVVNYISHADQMQCAIQSATLLYVRSGETGKPAAAPVQK